MATVHRICSIPDCNKRVEAHGWCVRHYKRWQRSGSPEFAGKSARPCCLVSGCGNPFKAKGFCDDHYRRFLKYGAPEAGPTFRGAPATFFSETVLTHDGDDCLLWPYAIGSHGYGTITLNGELKLVHRAACEARHGRAPSPDLDAAHNCGSRACCNPKHLRWDTRSGNMEDMLAHDTHHRGGRQWMAKLTEPQVREIRRLKLSMSLSELAARYGVSVGAIRGVVSRKTWVWLE